MASKRRGTLVVDKRGFSGTLDINDALRLAVEDKRFAAALLSEPEKFADAFNISAVELGAIRGAIGEIGADAAFEYE